MNNWETYTHIARRKPCELGMSNGNSYSMERYYFFDEIPPQKRTDGTENIAVLLNSDLSKLGINPDKIEVFQLPEDTKYEVIFIKQLNRQDQLLNILRISSNESGICLHLKQM